MVNKQQARGGLETIDIKGKAYVTVAERIKAVTDVEKLEENRYDIERWERFEIGEKQFLTCHIRVWVDQDRHLTYSGTSQISFSGGMVNTTSGYENAETSALGRALGMAGVGLLEGVASADEIHKAQAMPQQAATKPVEPPKVETGLIHPTLMTELRNKLRDAGMTGDNATAFVESRISKPAPVTNKDVQDVIEGLDILLAEVPKV